MHRTETFRQFFPRIEVIGLFMIWSLAFVFLFMAKPISIYANDSEAGLFGGQLILKKSDNIVMESENLFVSLDEVRVSYVFRNVGSKDVVTMVAFPMPEICLDVSDGEVDTPVSFDLSSKDPLSFRIEVDGKSVQAKLDVKSKLNKDGSEKCVTYTYYWDQIFVAKKVLAVNHHYVPSTDSFMIPSDVFSKKGTQIQDPEWKNLVKDHCIEDSFTRSLQKNAKDAWAKRLRYVLKTALNWKGSIGTFKLTIRKPTPKSLVSLCWKGLKKIDKTTFEFNAKSFVPNSDLDILFINI